MPTAPVLRTCVQYLNAFCNRPDAVSSVVSGRVVGSIVPDKHVKFRVLFLEKFHPKPSEVAF